MILVFVETADGVVEETSLETIRSPATSPPRAAASRSSALVVGEASDVARKQLGGVRRPRRVRRRRTTTSRRTPAPPGPSVIVTVRAQAKSVVVTAAGTDRGNELLAHVAARLDVPMAANVVSFHGLSPFVVTRQVIGGSALEEMRLPQRPAIFSVAGHAVEARPAEQVTEPAVVEVRPEIAAADLVARVVSTEAGSPGPLRRPEVRAGRGGCRPRCRRPRRVRRT